MDERLRRALAVCGTAFAILIGAMIVARIVLPVIARELTMFFLSPGVLTVLFLLWLLQRRWGKR